MSAVHGPARTTAVVALGGGMSVRGDDPGRGHAMPCRTCRRQELIHGLVPNGSTWRHAVVLQPGFVRLGAQGSGWGEGAWRYATPAGTVAPPPKE